MCSRHVEPGAGAVYADSLDRSCVHCGGTYTIRDYQPHECERPYEVLIEDEAGGRASFTVRAIGPKGAAGTAWETAVARGYVPLAVLKIQEAAA